MKRVYQPFFLAVILALLTTGVGLLAPSAQANVVPPQPPAYYPSGPQTNVDESQLAGWRVCWSSSYGSTGESLAAILASCSGDYLLLAGRPVGSTVFDVLAAAPRLDVIFDTGTGNTPHDANGSGWYFNGSWSWGFALAGDPVNRNSCDTVGAPSWDPSGPNGNLRLCWHTGGDVIGQGWRSGLADNLFGNTHERFIFQPFADAAAPEVTAFIATSPTNSRDIPITAFTATDDSGTVAGYLITESSTPPAAGDAGWAGTAPTTHTVGADGSYTLYPWAKDSSAQVSSLFAFPASVVVDTVAPIVTVPVGVTVDTTGPGGAIVTFSASATDETAPAEPAVTCTPASGSTFPIGTTLVTCSASDDAGNTGSASFDVTVLQLTPVITWGNPAAIVYGTPLGDTQLDATATVPGTFVYTPGPGTILPLGTQTLHVDFTPDDTQTYTSASEEVSLTVTPLTKVSRSVAAYDGFVLESFDVDGIGGPIRPRWALRAGDNYRDRQYRSIMDFDTKLPARAVIVGVSLRIREKDRTGNPFAGHGDLLVDIRKGFFGTRALTSGDFQAPASKSGVGKLVPIGKGWHQCTLGTGSYEHLNLEGTTQFRLRFALADDGDASADYVRFSSGNADRVDYRPQLIIKYYVPLDAQ